MHRAIIEQRPTRSRTVNVESDTRVLLLGERTEPFNDLGLQFDLTQDIARTLYRATVDHNPLDPPQSR
jgi:hypothetical protein